MSIIVLVELLLGVLLLFSALVSAAALWVGPPRSRGVVRRSLPVEDRPDWPGRRSGPEA
ncbi:hypothetical protein [Nonomuraea candida]|uniref:hypothetical protein n=1 Tax=Nonomuraea candida TaxID=359159 RepID=UPI0012F93B36|nr:hypothetical protein [Nonomuraea candida]